MMSKSRGEIGAEVFPLAACFSASTLAAKEGVGIEILNGERRADQTSFFFNQLFLAACEEGSLERTKGLRAWPGRERHNARHKRLATTRE
jgi:hypothetical protein